MWRPDPSGPLGQTSSTFAKSELTFSFCDSHLCYNLPRPSHVSLTCYSFLNQALKWYFLWSLCNIFIALDGLFLPSSTPFNWPSVHVLFIACPLSFICILLVSIICEVSVLFFSKTPENILLSILCFINILSKPYGMWLSVLSANQIGDCTYISFVARLCVLYKLTFDLKGRSWIYVRRQGLRMEHNTVTALKFYAAIRRIWIKTFCLNKHVWSFLCRMTKHDILV